MRTTLPRCGPFRMECRGGQSQRKGRTSMLCMHRASCPARTYWRSGCVSATGDIRAVDVFEGQQYSRFNPIVGHFDECVDMRATSGRVAWPHAKNGWINASALADKIDDFLGRLWGGHCNGSVRISTYLEALCVAAKQSARLHFYTLARQRSALFSS